MLAWCRRGAQRRGDDLARRGRQGRCAVRNDRLPLSVSSGWVLLPPSIAAALSPLSFGLERRVLNRYPRRELPVTLQSRAYTWSQVRAFRRLYAHTRQERPRGLLED
jgi:hypothetical protein